MKHFSSSLLNTFKSIIGEVNNNEINYWQEKKQLTLDKDNENELEGSTKRFVEYAYTVQDLLSLEEG